jgi:hypothetical protein
MSRDGQKNMMERDKSFMDGGPIQFDQLAIHTAAFLLAALASAFVLVAPAPQLLPLAFVITLAPTVILGVPLFLILLGYSEHWINGISAVAGGFLVGAVPTALFTWPGCYKCSSSIHNVALVIDGTVTAAGWLSYGRFVVGIGLAGALGGFVFWLTLKCCGLRSVQLQTPLRHKLRAFAVFSAAVLLSISVFMMASLREWAAILIR